MKLLALLLLQPLILLVAANKCGKPAELLLRDNYDVLKAKINFFMEDTFMVEKLCNVLSIKTLKIKAASTKVIQFHIGSNIEITSGDIIVKRKKEVNPIINTFQDRESQILSISLKNAYKTDDVITVSMAYRVRFNKNLGFNMVAQKFSTKKEYMLVSDNYPHARGLIVGKDTRDSRPNITLSITAPKEFQVSTSLNFKDKAKPKTNENSTSMTHTFEAENTLISEVTIVIHRYESETYLCTNKTQITIYGSKSVLKSSVAAFEGACGACFTAKEEWDIDCFQNRNEIQLIAIPTSSLRHNTLGLLPFAEESIVYNPSKHIKSLGFKVTRNVMQNTLRAIFSSVFKIKQSRHDWIEYGFAGFYTYKTLPFKGYNAFDKLVPSILKLKDFEANTDTIGLMERIYTASDLKERHDTVAYTKSTSIFSMLERYCGEKELRQLFSAYLKKRACKEITTNCFLKFLSRERKDDLRMFISFIKREGVHIIKHDYSQEGLTFNQLRASKLQPEKINSQVTLPITYTLSNNYSDVGITVLEKTEVRNVVNVAARGAIPILNTESTGYYISEYSKEEYEIIIKNRLQNMPMAVQTTLLGDLWQSMVLNRIGFKVGYNALLKGFSIGKPQSLLLVQNIYLHLRGLIAKKNWEMFNERFWAEIAPAYDNFMQIVPSGEGAQYEETWSSLWKLAILTGERNATSKAREYFENWRKVRNSLPPREKAGVYCYGMKNPKYFSIMKDEMRNFLDAQDKRLVYSSIECLEDAQLLYSLLREVLNNYEEYSRENLHFLPEQGAVDNWNTTWTFVSEADPNSLRESFINSPAKKGMVIELAQKVKSKDDVNTVIDWLSVVSNQDNLGVDATYVEKVKTLLIFSLHNNLELQVQVNAYFFGYRTCNVERFRSHVETSCVFNQALKLDRARGHHDPLGLHSYCSIEGGSLEDPQCLVKLRKTGRSVCEFYRERKKSQLKSVDANFTLVSSSYDFKTPTISRAIDLGI